MKLKEVVESIQDDDTESIKRALLSSADACNVFKEERGTQFFPALHSDLRYACIFLSWCVHLTSMLVMIH